MLENQLIELVYSGKAPIVTGNYSHEYAATYLLDFTKLCDVKAGKKYLVSAESTASTANYEWARGSCLIVASGSVLPDTLPDAGVQTVANWGDVIEVSADASLYIAWGIDNYVQWLVEGGTVEEAPSSAELTATAVKVEEYPLTPVTPPYWQPVLPVCLGTAYGIFLPKDPKRVGIIATDGTVIAEESVTGTPRFIEIFGQAYQTTTSYLEWVETDVPIGERFYLRITYTDYTVDCSQPLVRVPMDGFVSLRYSCNEDAFGFPFATAGDYMADVRLPILLSKPQYSQKDETYEKQDGDVITLYAKYYKEWEGETEYLSEAIHDKIIAALSCDNVYINAKRVTKSDNYKVNWDEYDIDCDGKTKLARATFKVRENITQRNSNY